MDKDFYYMRMELWAKTWIEVANSDSCRNLETPTKWADRFLTDFDERFKNETTT